LQAVALHHCKTVKQVLKITIKNQGHGLISDEQNKENNDLRNLECTAFVGKTAKSYRRNNRDVFCLIETKKNVMELQCWISLR